MPKNIPTAAQRAKRLKAERGGTYTDVLHSLTTPDESSAVPRADAWLASILTNLQELGWPAASEPARSDGSYLAFCGPVQLRTVRDADHVDAGAPDADPDDPRWADIPLRLGVMAPSETAAGDATAFDAGARAGRETSRQIAARLDAELAEARAQRVRDAEAASTTPCPICGDRYPAHHLLAPNPQGSPVCPACVWDGDNHYRADLPHLATQIDRLLDHDLAAPAGWAAVAAVLALTCGANLGRRMERELQATGEWPEVLPRWGRPWIADSWNDPMERLWIWLPPRHVRHPAFARLGAAASLGAIDEALARHDPSLPQQAMRECRAAGVRPRPALWPAALAYAAAFTTQAAERDRHRKPVHVVDSTSDGLSLILEPFAVTGDAANVEYGLQAILEHVLFPALLGHGLYDEPHDDPARTYGADGDDRPARTSADAHISHQTNRAVQVAAVLAKASGRRRTEAIWDGRADPDDGAAPLGPTAPANADIDELRKAARVQAAELMYDSGGGMAMTCDQAWSQAGVWVPADDAPHAVRQAREFLTEGPHVDVLWAGPAGSLPEPEWVRVQVVEVNAHSTGPSDTPWLRVSDGWSLFGMALSAIAVLRRVDPEAEPAQEPQPEPDASAEPVPGPPSTDDLALLIDQYLHLAGHQLGPDWQVVDQTAHATAQHLLAALEQEHAGHFLTTFTMSINLFDTWHPCASGNAKPTPAIAKTGRPYELEFSFMKHDPECCDAPYGCELAEQLPALVTVLALFGGTVEARPAMPDDKPDDALRLVDVYWEVRDWEAEQVCQRVWRSDPDAPHGTVVETDTNPSYLPPWMIAEGWTVPKGGSAMRDAVPPPGWTPKTG